MKGIITVLGFTFRQQLRKKSFIISSIIVILFSVAAICVPSIINSVKSTSSNDKGASYTVFIIDSENVLGGYSNSLRALFPNYNIQLKQPSDKQDLIKKVQTDKNKSLMILNLKNGSPSFQYYVKNFGNGADPEDLSLVVKKIYSENILKQNNVSEDVISKAGSDVNYNVNELGRGTAGGMIAGYAVILLLFFAIYMYGYWVAMSIASEKTSRVMEVLITSSKPSRIVIGKSAGMGLLGLCQLLVLIAIDAAVYLTVYPKNFEIGGSQINLSNFSPFAVLMIIVYFILGFSLYAMMNAVAGSTVSKAEDVQQAIMPISLISIFSFYFAYSTILAPDSIAAAAASIIPFTAPFAMPSRILNSNASGLQITASLLILAATTVLMGLFSIKLYSSAVLHYGKRLKISELIKMSKSR